MSDFGNYVNSHGKTESPNESARAVIIQAMQRQGLRRVFRLPLERMSFFLSEEPDPNASSPKAKYIIQWRGDISA
jgi:hypothetical protein